MSDRITRADFLDRLRTGRAAWEALLAQVDQARMTQPGVEGDWSVKDVVAHVTWYEREMVGVLRARALVGSDLWALPTDERNAAVFEQLRHRPLSDVLAEAHSVYQELSVLAEALSDDDLNDAAHFPGMPTDWMPWQVIASNTFDHYPDHIAPIRAWLEKSR